MRKRATKFTVDGLMDLVEAFQPAEERDIQAHLIWMGDHWALHLSKGANKLLAEMRDKYSDDVLHLRREIDSRLSTDIAGVA